jgi:hypothetical protein
MKDATLADWTKLAKCATEMKAAAPHIIKQKADRTETQAKVANDNVAKPTPTSTPAPAPAPAPAAPVHDEPRIVNTYFHLFEHGTCHLLPKTDDWESPAWVQWRADHPWQWKWRPRTLDAQGALLRDAEGRYIRPGPWLNPDGTKHRSINAASMSHTEIMEGLAA